MTEAQIMQRLRQLDPQIKTARTKLDALYERRTVLWETGKADGVPLVRMAAASGVDATMITRTLRTRDIQDG